MRFKYKNTIFKNTSLLFMICKIGYKKYEKKNKSHAILYLRGLSEHSLF